MGWKESVLAVGADVKTANQTGDFDKFVEKKKNPTLSHDQIKKYSNEFPEIKTVLEDVVSHHQGIADEFQSVTDDLESGQADKPTALERTRAQSEKLKAESIANIDLATERAIALIEGLPDDQQQKATEYWVCIVEFWAASWSEVYVEVDKIFEHVVEWNSQVWEQVKATWSQIKNVFTQFWAWLGGLN